MKEGEEKNKERYHGERGTTRRRIRKIKRKMRRGESQRGR